MNRPLHFSSQYTSWRSRLPKTRLGLCLTIYEDDPRVKPAIPPAPGSSYPAAKAVSAWMYAVVLGELVPEKRSALLARGWLIAWGRVMAGLHYPSDVSAAVKLGDYYAQRLLSSPAFRADLAKAKEECQRVFAGP